MKRMNFLSTLLTTAIVAGSLSFGGAGVVSAATGVSIDANNFPDAVFRDYVKTNFDTNGDSMLDSDEIAAVDDIDLYNVDGLESVVGVKNFKNLASIELTFTDITALDVSGLTELYNIDIEFCQKCASINVNGCTGLWSILADGTAITSLDLSTNTELIFLTIADNPQLSMPDLSHNSKLMSLCIENNNYSSLDLSALPKLSSLLAYGNNFTSIDIGPCEKLQLALNGSKVEKEVYDIDFNKFVATLYTSEDGNCELWLDSDCGITVNQSPVVTPNPTTPNPTTAPTTAPTAAPTADPSTTVGPIPTAAPTEAAKMNVGDFVNRCYKVALGRDADDDGFDYWKNKLVDGQACGAQVGHGFIFSGEYIAKNKTNEEYVNDLYDMFFGRKPDEAGYEGWLSQLNNGTDREVVFAGFANSAEFYNLCNDYGVVSGYYAVGVDSERQGGVNCFVARLYKTCLNRLPDMGSQAGWVQKLLANEVTGSSIAYSFTFSPEFIQMNLSNEEFVAYMYRAFFGREADDAGFTGWVTKMNGGASTEDVFNGFTGSVEFDALCQSYGITR